MPSSMIYATAVACLLACLAQPVHAVGLRAVNRKLQSAGICSSISSTPQAPSEGECSKLTRCECNDPCMWTASAITDKDLECGLDTHHSHYTSNGLNAIIISVSVFIVVLVVASIACCCRSMCRRRREPKMLASAYHQHGSPPTMVVAQPCAQV
jgi:hypothetical protein